MIRFWIYLKTDFASFPNGLILGCGKEESRRHPIFQTSSRNVECLLWKQFQSRTSGEEAAQVPNLRMSNLRYLIEMQVRLAVGY